MERGAEARHCVPWHPTKGDTAIRIPSADDAPMPSSLRAFHDLFNATLARGKGQMTIDK
jgi:hypothetical protein